MALEITWLGRSCFRLKGKEGIVITDPCPPESGYRLGSAPADVVTISHKGDPGCSFTEGISGESHVFDAPGEYEVGGILITGIATKRQEGRNIAFIFELDGIRIGHLGLPAPTPGGSAIDEMKGIDILLWPVGGGQSLGGSAAADVMTTIDPHIAIPGNFKTDLETADLDPLERFLKELGAKPEPQAKLTISRTQLPADLTVMVLQPKL